MSDLAESAAPKAHARIVYLGPVSPHWEVYGDWGDRQTLDEFRARVLARLVLLPRDDPQFRRNRERIVRDAEREAITIEWDIGLPTAVTPRPVATEQPPTEQPPTDGAGDADEAASDDADEGAFAATTGDAEVEATADVETPEAGSDDDPSDTPTADAAASGDDDT